MEKCTMKPTREQIEAKYNELEKVHEKDKQKAWKFLGNMYPYFVETSYIMMIYRFVCFLNGDDKRFRFECHECDIGCALLMPFKNDKPRKCPFSDSGKAKTCWKRVGAE